MKVTPRWLDDLDEPVEVIRDGDDGDLAPEVNDGNDGGAGVVRPTGPDALTAARRPVKVIEGIPDADLAAYELRAEAAMVQALQQVMDSIADRIAKAGGPS